MVKRRIEFEQKQTASMISAEEDSGYGSDDFVDAMDSDEEVRKASKKHTNAL